MGAPRRDITVRPLCGAHSGIKRVRCRPRLDGHRLGRATGLRARARSRAAGCGHSSPGVRTKWVGAQFPRHRCFGRGAAPLARSGSRRAYRHFPPHRVQSIEVRPLLSQGRRRDCQQHESNCHCRSPGTSHGWKTLLHSFDRARDLTSIPLLIPPYSGGHCFSRLVRASVPRPGPRKPSSLCNMYNSNDLLKVS